MSLLLRKILRFIIANKSTSRYIKKIYFESKNEKNIEINISESSLIECRDSEFEDLRLNLLIPALSVKHVFGGISTALEIFESIGKDFANLRIILTDEQNFEYTSNEAFKHWTISKLSDEDSPGKVIVAAGDRYNKTLAVGKGDRVIASAWWTAIIAKNIQKWQGERFNGGISKKFVYLIQDFEPGFYPWSSRFALALATYHDTEGIIAIFNTSILKVFFDNEGLRFNESYVYEPALNRKLQVKLSELVSTAREKKVLIYGRPSVERNAFEVIVMGLRRWISDNQTTKWVFVSAGENYPDIDLGFGHSLSSVGKLSLSEYAGELRKASIGISLMISPHPSYPPLEMAAFGINVITNSYRNKNLSKLSSLIYSLDSVNPEEIAKALTECVDQCEKENDFKEEFFSDYLKQYIQGNGGFHDSEAKISQSLRNI